MGKDCKTLTSIARSACLGPPRISRESIGTGARVWDCTELLIYITVRVYYPFESPGRATAVRQALEASKGWIRASGLQRQDEDVRNSVSLRHRSAHVASEQPGKPHTVGISEAEMTRKREEHYLQSLADVSFIYNIL